MRCQAYRWYVITNAILGVGSAHTAFGDAKLRFALPLKQGNACGGKGLTVEPFRQGHIFRTQMRVKDDNKTVLTTYPETDREVLPKPDVGNLHVRFCEGDHSSLGSITSKKGALCALLDSHAEG